MAIKGAVRFKPDMYRSTLEATVGGLQPTPEGGGPPKGTVYMPVQLVAYDDAQVGTGGNPYVPGAPASEQFITVLYEDTLQMDLAAFNGISQAAATALWATALDNWKTWVTPAGVNLLKATRAARNLPPSVI
jgi:hypothetical protein